MDIRLDLHLMLPELLVVAAALGAIVTELLLPPGRRARATAGCCLAGLALAFVWLLVDRPSGVAMEVAGVTGWHSDGFSRFCRGLLLLGGMLLVLLSMPYTRRMDRGHGELYALLLFALLGAMLVSGVSDLLSMFVCLELVTISSYVMVALKRNDLRSTEAGLKYLVIGAVSTAVLLLGIAFLYGATGTLAFGGMREAFAQAPTALLAIGAALTLAGLLFKVGAVPFHVWIPDVYQGAPSPVTAFLSTASKAAGLVLLLRIAETTFLPARGVGGVAWGLVLALVAGVTLVFGVLGAVPQRSIKRLLGYSSIGHAGYLLIGVAAIAAAGEATPADEALVPGASAILYYLLAFFVTNLTAFAVIVLVGGATGSHEHHAWTGLSRRAPFLAFAMLLALLSLAGVPPMGGFFAKFLVLSAAVRTGDLAMLVLALVGAAGVVVSLYFYLLWVKEMYVRAPARAAADAGAIRIGLPSRLVLWTGIAGMVALGFGGPFYAWAEQAARALLTAAS